MNSEGTVETWEFQGGTFTGAGSWKQRSSGGNKILEWNTDVATTRKQVNVNERKSGIMISYRHPDNGWINEQYIGTAITDVEWVKDNNWKELVTKNILSDYQKAWVDFNSGKVNLIDNLDWIRDDYVMDDSGRDFAQPGYILSDYMDISYLQGRTIYIQLMNNGYVNICFYDTLKKSLYVTRNKGYSPYTVPKDTVYMRVVKNKEIGQDYMYVVSENFTFYNTYSLEGANYLNKKFDIGYRKDNQTFINGCGSGKIAVNSTDKLYMLAINFTNPNQTYTPLLAIFDKQDEEIAVFGFYLQTYKTGVLYEIEMKDYPEASYFIASYTFNPDNSIAIYKQSNCFIFAERDRKNNKYLNDYINFIKSKNTHYIVGIHTPENFIFSKTDDASGEITNLEYFEMKSTFLYTLMKNKSGIANRNIDKFSFFGLNLNNVVPNETDFQTVINYNFVNTGKEENLILFKYYQMLRPDIPVEQALEWDNGRNALIISQLTGCFAIKDLRILVVNKKYSNANVYDSFIPIGNGIIADGARYACGITSMFANHTVCLFGDSIMESRHAQNVAQIVARHFNMKPLNLALSGSRPNANTQIDQNDTGWNLRNENLDNIPLDTRIVIIAGGTNNPSAALGSIDDREARNTMYGCLNYAIDYILNKIPECIVVLLGGIQKKGGTVLDKWNDSMKTLAEHRKDCLYADSGNALITDKTLPYVSYDGTHPMNPMSMRYAASALNALRKVVC